MRHRVFTMRFYITLILTIALTSVFGCARTQSDDATDALLSKLDKVIAKRGEYFDVRKSVDDSLRTAIYAATDPYEKATIAERLGVRYDQVSTDSSIHYFTMARDIAREAGDKSLELRMEAHRVSMLAIGGDLYLASQLFNAIDTTKIIERDKQEFYAAGAHLYLSFASFTDEREAENFRKYGRQCAVGYLEKTPQDTPPYNYVSGLVAFLDNRKARAKALLSDVIENTAENDPYHSYALEILGTLELNEGNNEDAMRLLSDAVMCDIKNGVRIDNCTRLLANAFMRDGNFRRADNMLAIALDNALESGDRMRFTQAAELAPSVTDSYRRTGKWIFISLIALAVVCLAAIATIIYMQAKLRKCRRQNEEIEKRVKSTDTMRMHYFNKFLTMCAVFIERLEDYKKVTQRKIKAGQIDDLYKMIKSGELLQHQTDTFYTIFDSAFIQAYPTFVTDVNTLMQPDKMLDIPPADSLSTDHRILAFMRIGFDDSTQIARFMGLSVNTIYTYRNRLRSRAKDRDTFESDVMKIGS